jgi:hypothetical protein
VRWVSESYKARRISPTCGHSREERFPKATLTSPILCGIIAPVRNGIRDGKGFFSQCCLNLAQIEVSSVR